MTTAGTEELLHQTDNGGARLCELVAPKRGRYQLQSRYGVLTRSCIAAVNVDSRKKKKNVINKWLNDVLETFFYDTICGEGLSTAGLISHSSFPIECILLQSQTGRVVESKLNLVDSLQLLLFFLILISF